MPGELVALVEDNDVPPTGLPKYLHVVFPFSEVNGDNYMVVSFPVFMIVNTEITSIYHERLVKFVLEFILPLSS